MFGKNIQLLRKRKGHSQEHLSEALGITRSSLSGYEIGSSEPGFELLLKFSDYFAVSTDVLLRKDLTKMKEFDLKELEQGWSHEAISGKKLRILATTVDTDNNENTELVPVKAKAGYTRGFADPDYIKVLPAFHLPFLSRERKYRTFPISGDSMLPIPDNSWVTGEYLQNWNFIKSGLPYVIVTKDEGIVFKILYNHIKEKGTFLACSTNPAYMPYEIPVSEVLEIWKFVHFISSEIPEGNKMKDDDLTKAVINLQKEVAQLRMKFEE
ncbi:MAG: XRE family transcriptional regulator [Bacteroidia bacterium]